MKRQRRRRIYTNENDVKAEVRAILTETRWKHWPAAAGPHTEPGVSDRLALRKGQFLAVESKFEDNPPTKWQRKFAREVIAQGGFAFLVNERNIEAFRRFIYKFVEAQDG